MPSHHIQQLLSNILIGIVIVSYAIMQSHWIIEWPQYLTDEIMFRDTAAHTAEQIVQAGWWNTLWQQTNEFGYGSLYWVVHGSLALQNHGIDGGMIGMRTLAWLALVSNFLLLWYYVRNERYGIWVILMWLCFPMNWWYGKLTGPELFTIPFMLTAVLLVLQPRKWYAYHLAWLCVGVALGLKMNNLPIIVFVAAGLFTHTRSWWPAIQLPIGLWLTSPFMIVHFPTWLQLQIDERMPMQQLNQLWYVLSNNDYWWDGVFNGGLLQWGFTGLGLAGLIALLAYTYKRSYWQIPAAILTGVFTLSILLTNYYFRGWYWLPMLPVLVALYLLVWQQPRRSYVATGAVLLILVQFLTAYPNIQAEVLRHQLQSPHKRITYGPFGI